MDLNPFSIARTVGQILKNKDKYEKLAEKLENKVVIGEAGNVRVHLAMKTGRVAKVELPRNPTPDHLIAAINHALDIADSEWSQAEGGAGE